MKAFILSPLVVLAGIFNNRTIQFSSAFQADTTTINHLLDGNLAEWPADKLTTDKTTNTRYAVDNDNQVLYLAITISDKSLQQRVMQKGMSLFIDVKGKKKVNRGVQFPLGMENVPDIGSMKIFGFGHAELVSQNIKSEGTINIAIGWDSAYVLNIEYNIPLKMLEESIAELNNKKISVGWKINEADAINSSTNENSNTRQPVSTTTRLVAVPAGTRPVISPTTGSGRANPTPPQPATGKSEPSTIWATHTISF